MLGKKIRDSTQVSDVEAFLKTYPKRSFCRCRPAARLGELRKGEVEAREWNRIKNFRAVGAFETFLKTYPNGRFAAAGSPPPG